MLRRFKVVLEPNESGGYTVHVPLLPGCISEGDNREEAESCPARRVEAPAGVDGIALGR